MALLRGTRRRRLADQRMGWTTESDRRNMMCASRPWVSVPFAMAPPDMQSMHLGVGRALRADGARMCSEAPCCLRRVRVVERAWRWCTWSELCLVAAWDAWKSMSGVDIEHLAYDLAV